VNGHQASGPRQNDQTPDRLTHQARRRRIDLDHVDARRSPGAARGDVAGPLAG
jgi:hypothetical protein